MNMNFYRKYIRPRLTLWRRPLKPELLKLLLAAVWFVFCIYMVALANAYADRRNPNANRPPADRYVAPDPLMEATNSWFMGSGMPQGISDTLVGVSAGLIFAFALTRGPACITIVRRALLIVGSLYLGRTPYMLLTVLPAPWRYCFTDINPNFGVDSWLLFSGQRVDCGDTFYSGHTIVFTSSAMLYWYHCRYFIITIPVLLLNLFGMISLVFSGYHYTIDVIGGAVFTFLCWWLFHLAVEIDEIGTQRWWGRLVRWFDNNGHEVLEEREGTKQLMMAATGRGGRVDVERDGLELPTIHSEQPAIVPSTLPSTQLQPPSPHRHNQRRRSGEIIELPRLSLSTPDHLHYNTSSTSSAAGASGFAAAHERRHSNASSAHFHYPVPASQQRRNSNTPGTASSIRSRTSFQGSVHTPLRTSDDGRLRP